MHIYCPEKIYIVCVKDRQRFTHSRELPQKVVGVDTITLSLSYSNIYGRRGVHKIKQIFDILNEKNIIIEFRKINII